MASLFAWCGGGGVGGVVSLSVSHHSALLSAAVTSSHNSQYNKHARTNLDAQLQNDPVERSQR